MIYIYVFVCIFYCVGFSPLHKVGFVKKFWKPGKIQKWMVCRIGNRIEQFELFSKIRINRILVVSLATPYLVQPIPFGLTIRKLFQSSKLKAQRSNVSCHSIVAFVMFHLSALSFETEFEHVTPSGIGCICEQGISLGELKVHLGIVKCLFVCLFERCTCSV